jgi:hypothetical protein
MGYPSITTSASFYNGLSKLYSAFLTSSHKPILSADRLAANSLVVLNSMLYRQHQEQRLHCVAHSTLSFIAIKPFNISEFHSEAFYDNNYRYTELRNYCFIRGARGSVVVKALCYKPEGTLARYPMG